MRPDRDRTGKRLFGIIWRQTREFCALSATASYLWPRWIVLRAVGFVYVLIFAGIIEEAQMLIGPRGLTPLAGFFANLNQRFPVAVEAFIQAPSLFWAGTGSGMIALLAWSGLLAAVCVVLNLWPRMALFACWLIFLSFVSTWGLFSGSQVDQLMLETALLCIPFAPAGYRPGLGMSSPPRPIAVFMMRWLLIRVMFESGVVKLLSGDPRWRDFTALDYLYETSPFPTILGYLDHQLPHSYHLLEVALTYFAELVAPILAVFGGRRGRWVAFGTWIAFQAGIELTNNFGWLNAASIALGFLLLDDEMVATAALKLKLRPPGWLRAPKAMPLAIASWKLYGLRTALWTHFCLTLYFFGCLFGSPMEGLPSAVSRSLKSLVENFHSANPYTLYGGLLPARYVVEFEGTNDGGKTWRTYDFRYQPQRTDRICPFIAPWYPRFEATLQIEATYSKPSPLYSLVARHLLAGNLGANGLFQRDPFPDRPPTIIRMPVYRLTFTDSATRRQTGDFWRKEYKGQYLPMVVAAASATDAVRLMAEQGNAKAQNHLGNMYAAGRGLTKDSAEAAKWYRKAAEQGLADAQSTLGVMYAEGDGVARDEVEALVWFILAARGGDQDARKNREIAESRIGPAGVLAARQRSDIIAAEIETRKNRK